MNYCKLGSSHLSRTVQMLLISSALFLLCSCQSKEREPPRAKPNMILIVIDTLRASNVSFLGYSRETTPNLDELAETSYVFETAVSVGGNTATAMSGIMTGHYSSSSFKDEWVTPHFGMDRFYVDSSEAGLPRILTTLAEHVNSAGYTTAGFITNPHLKEIFNFHRGFDHYQGIFREKDVPYGLGEDVSRSAIEFLSSNPNQPFFLYLHYMDTHGPYWPPAPYRERFRANDSKFVDDRHSAWRRWEKEVDLKSADADELADYMRNLYDGAVGYVDDSIGQLTRHLEELELMDDTVIVITADHGDEFREHGGTTHKGTLYDELVRVPLIIRIPGKPGGRIHDLVRNFDVMPTLLDLAGIDVTPHRLDAVNLKPLLDGDVDSLRLAAFAAFPTTRMLRTSRYKLLNFRDKETEFYDLHEDPGEQRNLYASHRDDPVANQEYSERISSFEAAMARLVARFETEQPGGQTQGPGIDPTTEKQLRALGYLN